MEFRHQDTSRIRQPEIEATAQAALPYVQLLNNVAASKDYTYHESFINLPFDEKLISSILKVKKEKTTDQLRYIIDIGIGGSNLGTKAIYDALYGYFDIIEPNRFPKIIFSDTNDPEFLTHLQRFLITEIKDPAEILFSVISKSGTTTETIVNLEFLESHLHGTRNRLVIISDANSKLTQASPNKGISHLSIPEKVGGRFSVFSAVGLFPLSLAGIDVSSLLQGARTIHDVALSTDLGSNTPLTSAVILHLQSKRGKNINDNFIFHPELESLGKWYRQLMAESIGKEEDISGNVVNAGITPTVSIGSIDLHSMAQLYLGGPKDKFTTFVWAAHRNDKTTLPHSLPFPDLVGNIQGKTATDIMRAIYQGVTLAYRKRGLP